MSNRKLLTTLLLSCLIPLASNAEIEFEINWDNVYEGIRCNSEKIIDYTRGGYIPEIDSVRNYILSHKNYDLEYILVPRQIDKPWNQSRQVIIYANMYQEAIKQDIEMANILVDIYKNASENPKYVVIDKNEKDVLKLVIENISDAKEQKSALKDYEKGRVSNKVLPYLEKYYDYYVDNIETNKSEYEKLKKDPVNFIARKFNKEIALDKKTIYDTVPNPLYRDKFFWNDYFLEAMREDLIGDWEWVYSEDGEYVEQEYPVRQKYYKYSSHPGVRICGEDLYGYSSDKERLSLAFDDDGNLIRVINGGEPNAIEIPYHILDRFDSNGVGQQIAIWEYEDNKYDIKSQPKKVQDYITDQLGLRQKTKAEKARSDKASTTMANAMADYMKADSRHGKNTKKSNRAKDKAAEDFLGALLGSSLDYYSPEGDAWFAQIVKDNKQYFEALYDLVRIDNTTFKGTLVDKNHKPVFELVFTYTTGKYPYTVNRTISINKL